MTARVAGAGVRGGARASRLAGVVVRRTSDSALRRATGLDRYQSAAVEANRRLATALAEIERVLAEKDHRIARLEARIRELGGEP